MEFYSWCLICGDNRSIKEPEHVCTKEPYQPTAEEMLAIIECAKKADYNDLEHLK